MNQHMPLGDFPGDQEISRCDFGFFQICFLPMSIRDQLLHDIERFLKQSGMDHTRFGKEALNDPSFVARLRSGKDVRTGTVDRIRNFIAEKSRPLAGRRRAEQRPAA
jgi:hypothetical protein